MRFESIGEERGLNRASAMVPIVNGKYQVETGGGLQQGRYRVRVGVERKTGKKTTKRTFSGDIVEVDETDSNGGRSIRRFVVGSPKKPAS